jgi:sulfotransferase
MDLEPKKNQNKQLFFLVALPRSGNTLFTSIINQNPEIVCTPNSITLEIMKDLFLLKQTDVFLNYQDHDSLDNVLDSVFDNYYKDWPQQYIIDRGPVMTPGNLMLMQKHYRRPFKCIVILRDLMDVLASYMKWYKNNPDAFPNRFNLNTDDEKLGMIMNKDGAVAKDLEAIKNAFNYPDICHFVKYDNLISRPEQEMRKIYQFIGLPYYNHQFQDLKQINVNGIGYDDKVVGKNMHTIRNVVRKEINPYLDQIPERIRQKYGHIRF